MTTETRTEIIKRLWQEGASGKEIARRIGVTRNVVIGTIWRARQHGEALRSGAPRKDVSARTGPVVAPKPRKAPKPPKPAKAPKPMPAPPPPPPPAPEPMGLDIMDLERDSCRWIHSDGTYCGATTRDGRSYCDHHHAVCYQPAPNKVDRAIRATALRSERLAKGTGWWL